MVAVRFSVRFLMCSADCVLPLPLSLMRAFVASLRIRPLKFAARASTVARTCFLPLLASPIRALISGDLFWPRFARLAASSISGEGLDPFVAALNFARVSAVCTTPSALPARGARLYPPPYALSVSIQNCSRSIKAAGSTSSKTANSNASGPYLDHARWSNREWCLPRSKARRCTRQRVARLTAEPT